MNIGNIISDLEESYLLHPANVAAFMAVDPCRFPATYSPIIKYSEENWGEFANLVKEQCTTIENSNIVSENIGIYAGVMLLLNDKYKYLNDNTIELLELLGASEYSEKSKHYLNETSSDYERFMSLGPRLVERIFSYAMPDLHIQNNEVEFYENILNPKTEEITYSLNEAGIKTTMSGDFYGDKYIYIDLDIKPNLKEPLPNPWTLSCDTMTESQRDAERALNGFCSGDDGVDQNRVRLIKVGIEITLSEVNALVDALKSKP